MHFPAFIKQFTYCWTLLPFFNMNNTVLYIHVTYVYVCVSVSLIPWWISGGLFLYQFSSVTRSCPTLCDPMDCSTPGLPVHHQPLGFTQTHVHWVSNQPTISFNHLILCRPLFLSPSIFPSITWYWTVHLNMVKMANFRFCVFYHF